VSNLFTAWATLDAKRNHATHHTSQVGKGGSPPLATMSSTDGITKFPQSALTEGNE